jgi:hypothetical protein
MEELGEQCTVVFTFIVTEPDSECVPPDVSVTIYAKTTVHCSPDSSISSTLGMILFQVVILILLLF